MSDAEPPRPCGHPRTEATTIWRKLPDGGRKADGCRPCRTVKDRERARRRAREAGVAPRPTAADSADGRKRCPACGERKDLTAFPRRTSRSGGYLQGRATHCTACQKARVQEYRRQHPGYQEGVNRRNAARRRLRVLVFYGGDPPSCACCGEIELAFLTIDHVNNDGAEHRRRLRAKGSNVCVYRDLCRLGFPPGFQVLCMNCNWAKRLGTCPHQARAELTS